jgi:hypothetical protein
MKSFDVDDEDSNFKSEIDRISGGEEFKSAEKEENGFMNYIEINNRSSMKQDRTESMTSGKKTARSRLSFRRVSNQKISQSSEDESMKRVSDGDSLGFSDNSKAKIKTKVQTDEQNPINRQFIETTYENLKLM